MVDVAVRSSRPSKFRSISPNIIALLSHSRLHTRFPLSNPVGLPVSPLDLCHLDLFSMLKLLSVLTMCLTIVILQKKQLEWLGLFVR